MGGKSSVGFARVFGAGGAALFGVWQENGVYGCSVAGLGDKLGGAGFDTGFEQRHEGVFGQARRDGLEEFDDAVAFGFLMRGLCPEQAEICRHRNDRDVHFLIHVPDARLIAHFVVNWREVAFGIDQDAVAIGFGAGDAFGQGGGFAGAAAACVDDDGAKLAQDAADKGQLFEMVASDEDQPRDFGIRHEAITPALMLGGDDIGAGFGQVVFAIGAGADACTYAQSKPHGTRIGADDESGGAAARYDQGEDGRQRVDHRDGPIGNGKEEGSHGMSPQLYGGLFLFQNGDDGAGERFDMSREGAG